MSYVNPTSSGVPQEPNRKPIFITAIAIGAAAAVGILVIVFTGVLGSTGTGGAEASEHPPSTVIEKYLDAIKSADVKGALDYRCQDDVDAKHDEWGGEEPPQDKKDKAEANAATIVKAEVVDEKIDGDKATVDVAVEYTDSPSGTVRFSLILENDEWLMCGEPKDA